MRTLVYTLLIFCVSLVCIELWARSPQSERVLLSESHGFEQPYFDQRLADLDYLAQTDPFDCVIMGSSVVFYGINPSVFQVSYEKETDVPLTCVTYGIPSIYFYSNSIMAQIIQQRYRPRLIILGVSLRDVLVYENWNDPMNASVPWTDYMTGAFNGKGFLLQHLASYRHLEQYVGWYQADLVSDARDSVTSHRINQFIPHRSGLGLLTSYPFTSLYEKDFRPIEDNVAEFRQLMDMDPTPTVLLLEIPIHFIFLQQMVDGMVLYDDFLQIFQQLSQSYQVPFWQTTHLEFLTAESWWADGFHMAGSNANRFSWWLGEQIGELRDAGFWDSNRLSDPPSATYRADFLPLWKVPPAYQQAFAAFVPPFLSETLLFNPNTTIEKNGVMIQNLLDYLQANPDLGAEQTSVIFSLLHAFDQMRFETNFPQIADDPRFRAWRRSDLDPHYLRDLGIEYLIFSDLWLSWTSEQGYANLTNPDNYQLVQSLTTPDQKNYFIYRVNADQ